MTFTAGRKNNRVGTSFWLVLLPLLGWMWLAPTYQVNEPVPSPSAVFELEVPELGVSPTSQPEIAIPSNNVSLVLIHILRPKADNIDYGQISTFVNGEATATLHEVASSERGKLIRIFLTRRPGFALVPGRNTVEVRAQDRRGRVFYASFVIHTVTESRNQDFLYRVEPGTDPKQPVPPDLMLLEPEHEVEVQPGRKTQTIRIAGVATAVTQVERVSLDGHPMPLKRGAQTSPRMLGLVNEENRVTFDVNHTLGEGATQVVVEAVDSSDNKTQLRIPVRLRQGTPSIGFRGRKFAVVIGISKFRHHEGGLHDLKYADLDAQSFYKFLQTPAGGGFSPDHILLLINEQATLASLRQALTTFVAGAGPDDLVLIYLASHGSPDPYAPQNLYFLVYDSQVDQMPESALSMTSLRTMLQQNLKARRMVLFIDTCHSGGLTGSQGELSRGVTNNLVNLYAQRLLFGEEGRAVITSSDVNESSQEAPRWGGGHGVFTYFLLDGLQGKADMNHDGMVSVGELFRYVHQKVRWETQFRQNPRILVGTNENLVLSATTPSTTGH